jgi:hypothetical protein
MPPLLLLLRTSGAGAGEEEKVSKSLLNAKQAESFANYSK